MILVNFLFLIVLVLLITLSIKSRVLYWIITSLLVFFIVMQAASVIMGGGFIDYRFLNHFNIRDIRVMGKLFYLHVAGLGLFAAMLLVKFYLTRRHREKLCSILGKPVRYTLFGASIIIMSINPGVLYHAYVITKIYTADASSFEASRLKLGFNPYITSNEITAVGGRNIVILSLESLEKGFLTEKYAHLTPNLRQLSVDWNYIDMEAMPGCDWTVASLYALLTGLPSFIKGDGNAFFQNTYDSRIPSLGAILGKAGYDLSFYIENSDFGGTKDLLNTFSIHTIIDNRNIAEHYGESFTSARDKDLFDSAKKELLKKKSEGSSKPYALILSTVDTHHPDGLLDERFEEILPHQNSTLEFMISAVDHLVGDFARFLESEGLLENTVVYIFPDHLKMGDPSMFTGTGERGLYLMTNASKSDLGVSDSQPFTQLDLTSAVLKGAFVQHNAKFLSDYVPEEKKRFVNSNIGLLTGLNTAGLIRSEIWEKDLTISLDRHKNAVVSVGITDKKISMDTLQHYTTRMSFSREMRLLKTEFFPLSNSLLPRPETGHLAVNFHLRRDTLVGFLQSQTHLPVLKMSNTKLSFGETDIKLIKSLPFHSDPRNSTTFGWIDNEPIEVESAEQQVYSEHQVEIPFDVIGGYIELEYSTSGHASPFVIAHSQPYSEASLSIHDKVSPSEKRSVVRLPFTKQINNTLLIFRNWSTHGTFTVHNFKILGVGYENEYRFSRMSGNVESYKSDKSRFIAHAGGAINGEAYTNSLEALDHNYARGFRFFELDISETSDGKFVAAHDWRHWSTITDYRGPLPASEDEFLKYKIFGKYTPLNMARINEWFTKHPDAILVTDKINTPLAFANAFIDRKRLMMELFTIDAIHEGIKAGIKSPMMNEEVLEHLEGDRVAALKALGITDIVMSRGAIARNVSFLKRLQQNNIRVYVFHVNFEAGKNEQYVVNFEMDYVYGLYADNWKFE